MKLRVAAVFAPGRPSEIIEIDAAPSRKSEVLIKVTYTGVRHINASTLSGGDSEGIFLVILSHEGADVVIKVGEDVASAKSGDHMTPPYITRYGGCEFYRSDRTNLCVMVHGTQGRSLMPDGTTRFSYNRQPFYHYMERPIFSEHTAAAEVPPAKVNPGANHEHVCLPGCGATIGTDVVYNTVKVQPGDPVTMFDFGTAGLAVTQGVRQVKVGRVITIDTNPEKFDLTRRFGTTDRTNSGDHDRPTKDVLPDTNKWSIDYAFECVGNANVMCATLESTHRGWGQSVTIGVAVVGQEISTRPFQSVTGRVWKGSVPGGAKGYSQLPGTVEDVTKGDIDLESFATRTISLDGVNNTFDLTHEGKSVRAIIRYRFPADLPCPLQIGVFSTLPGRPSGGLALG